MNENAKRLFTNIGKIDKFSELMNLIAQKSSLDFYKQSLLLSSALLFNEEYKKEKEISYLEFAYYLLLKVAILGGNVEPLYQFSVNNGLYPIARALYHKYSINEGFESYLIDQGINDYIYQGRVEIYNQKINRESIINSNNQYISYVAPTSYGKSTLVMDDILNKLSKYNKIGIIVPKKSLISQYYNDLKRLKQRSHKVIMHDKNYFDEDKVIAILTQERALRLIENNDFVFDTLYIDEAHNIFEYDPRNILLARLIRQNRIKNPNQRVIYLSPLINDNGGLSIDNNIPQEFRIDFNIKDYDIYYFDGRSKSFYSRFFNKEYELPNNNLNKFDYIRDNSKNKNLVYLCRPKEIESFSNELAKHMDYIKSDDIDELCNILKDNVDESFYNIECIRKGIIYIHGKIPDNIKEYLEYKYRTMKKIKFLIANSVILEGVNLPIESIFLVDTYGLHPQASFNLIGRANRLNYVFGQEDFDLERLMVPIHFIDDILKKEAHNKLNLLRNSKFKNNIENPILDNTTKPDEKIKKIEDRLIELEDNDEDSIEKIILATGIYSIYNDPGKAIEKISNNIASFKEQSPIEDDSVKRIMSIINYVFLKGFAYEELKDKDAFRLANEKTLIRYRNYIVNAYHKSFKQKINYLCYLIDIYKTKYTPMYIGSSYGEESLVGGRSKLYIRFNNKTDKEIHNLAIVLAKIEDDYISFYIERFADALFSLELINENEYNEFIYGTKDNNEMNLVKLGLSTSLINYLKENNAISGIRVTRSGFFECSCEIKEIINSANDLIKFEFDKYFN